MVTWCISHSQDAQGRQKELFTAIEFFMSTQILTSVEQVLSGNLAYFSTGADCQLPPRVIFPGSFNPLHTGHRKIASVAATVIGSPVHYEIASDNVDKASLSSRDIVQRLDQFAETETVVITTAATFDQKAIVFPGTVFAVGIDTLSRIGSLTYYSAPSKNQPDDPQWQRDQAIDQIAEQGCRLLVFGRKIEGQFCSLGDLSIPPALEQLCQAVPESLFREDISSSNLR